MSNLKDIKRRIGSVEKTQQITSAMRMVAAAKLRRAESAIKAARSAIGDDGSQQKLIKTFQLLTF